MDHKRFIEKVSRLSKFDRETCGQLLTALTELIETSLAAGDSVSIPSFGSFEPRKRKERIMSHPSHPGKRLLVPPKLVASFKPSAILKIKINSVTEDGF